MEKLLFLNRQMYNLTLIVPIHLRMVYYIDIIIMMEDVPSKPIKDKSVNSANIHEAYHF